jgi:hypothetical protein
MVCKHLDRGQERTESSGQNMVKAYSAGLDRQRCIQLLMQSCYRAQVSTSYYSSLGTMIGLVRERIVYLLFIGLFDFVTYKTSYDGRSPRIR